MKGIITAIQRFSLNDGPGIRTTVFFKGCNMACKWCHNPETICAKVQLMQYKNNCINCLECVKVCSEKANVIIGNKHVFMRERCNSCGKCTKICYPGTLVQSGKEMGLDEIMDEIMQDAAYYCNSGGGATLSGGEVLLQAEFAYELLKKCKDHNIHTAIETNMYAPWDKINRLLEVTDLVMFDIKLIDPQEHEKWTGVKNEMILENIKKLGKKGIPFIIRTPVIPDVNDSPESIQNIAAFISALKGKFLYLELLNFNPLGEFKYKALDMDYSFEDKEPFSDERINELADAAKKYGIKVKIG